MLLYSVRNVLCPTKVKENEQGTKLLLCLGCGGRIFFKKVSCLPLDVTFLFYRALLCIYTPAFLVCGACVVRSGAFLLGVLKGRRLVLNDSILELCLEAIMSSKKGPQTTRKLKQGPVEIEYEEVALIVNFTVETVMRPQELKMYIIRPSG